MVKLYILRRKTDDKDVHKYFESTLVEQVLKVFEEQPLSGTVQGSVLLEDPFDAVYEVAVPTKEKMDTLLATEAGVALNKSLYDYHNFITVMFVEFPDSE